MKVIQMLKQCNQNCYTIQVMALFLKNNSKEQPTDMLHFVSLFRTERDNEEQK